MPYVCLGIGSNIAPRENLADGLRRLVAGAGELWVSDVLETAPVDMETSRAFLNTVVWFETSRDSAALKAWLNELEEAMGRDRSDPDRSTSDRTIDFDVLWMGAKAGMPAELAAADTPYFAAPYARLRAALQGTDLGTAPAATRVALTVQGRRVGMEPTAIHADGHTGDEAR